MTCDIAHQLEAIPAAALVAAGGVGAGVLALRGLLRALVNVLALSAISPPAGRALAHIAPECVLACADLAYDKSSLSASWAAFIGE